MLSLLRRLPLLRYFAVRPRLFFVILSGIAFELLLPDSLRIMTRRLVAWDAAIAFYLMLVAVMMARSDTKQIRKRSAIEDEGGLLILALTITTAIASLVAIVSELATAKNLSGVLQYEHIGLAALTVFLSWSFMQTMFALHYAHEYYSCKTGRTKPLEFPEQSEEPDYWDFVYFSFIIGTAAQTADVNIVSKTIRRIVTLHCVIVFFFNTTVLALTVNIGASLF